MGTRVLGLGNTILRDDGVGVVVAREVAGWLSQREPASPVEVVEAETAGFALLELLSGCERAIIVDAVDLPGVTPGELVELELDGPCSPRLRSVHELDLPTALALGRKLGHPMPSDVQVLGIQVEDMRTFGEELTPPVAAAVPAAVAEVIARLAR
jgi:hydrogenase maturation protease